jgi:hypothetical protein
MNQKIKKIIKYFLVLVLTGVSVSALAQWTPPSTTPPGGNIASPVNTGSSLQEKLGALVAGALQTNTGIFVGSSTGNSVSQHFRMTKGDISPNAGFFRFGDSSGWKLHFGSLITNGNVNSGTTGTVLTIQDNGRVGVGNASPAATLDVNGTIRISGGNPSAGRVLTSDAQGFASWVAPTGGTSTSTSPWTVTGNDISNSNTGIVNIKTNTVIDNARTISSANTTGAGEGFLWPRWSDNATYLNYGSNGFHIRNNSSAQTMFMTNSGNVGIGTGTTVPSHRLQVNGNIALQNSGIIGSGVAYGTTGNANSATLQLYASNGDTILNNQGFNIDLRTANTTRFFVGNNGNVGVGTATPATALDVNGAVKLGVATTCNTTTLGSLRYSSGRVELCGPGDTEVSGSPYWRSVGGETTTSYPTNITAESIKLNPHLTGNAPVCNSTSRGTLKFVAGVVGGHNFGSGGGSGQDQFWACVQTNAGTTQTPTYGWRKLSWE